MERSEVLGAIVNAAIDGDAAQMSELVQQEILARVADEVEALKPEIAASVFRTPQEEVVSDETSDQTDE